LKKKQVTIGLALCWPYVTDSVVYPRTGSIYSLQQTDEHKAKE